MDEVGVDLGGGERAVFEAAAEDDDGVGMSNGVVDDPGVCGPAQEGGAKSKAESGEKDYETTDYKTTGPQAARPLSG